jgi:cyanate permease
MATAALIGIGDAVIRLVLSGFIKDIFGRNAATATGVYATSIVFNVHVAGLDAGVATRAQQLSIGQEWAGLKALPWRCVLDLARRRTRIRHG